MTFYRNEDGAALLSVLLIVSVMSAAMVATFEILGLFTRLSATQSMAYQAREYARAAEIVGAEQAVKLSQNSELVALTDYTSPERRVSFPIEGGEVSGELIEISNCFNLSSLMQGNNGSGYEINSRSYDQYIRLLTGLGVGERQATALASSLVDWQDTDDRPMSMGAESFSYTQLEIPYRASNHLISQIEELRLVKGYTPELIDALKLITCVDPVSMETVVNVNTIRSDQARLIHALLGLPVSQQDIASIIEGRPASGFDHVARFWDQDILKNMEIQSEVRRQFSLKPKRYKILVDVMYGEATLHQESHIWLTDDNSYNIISRDSGI